MNSTPKRLFFSFFFFLFFTPFIFAIEKRGREEESVARVGSSYLPDGNNRAGQAETNIYIFFPASRYFGNSLTQLVTVTSMKHIPQASPKYAAQRHIKQLNSKGIQEMCAEVVRHKVTHALAWQGKVTHALAWQGKGKVTHALAWQGKVTHALAWQGKVTHALAWQGKVTHALAWQGKVTCDRLIMFPFILLRVVDIYLFIYYYYSYLFIFVTNSYMNELVGVAEGVIPETCTSTYTHREERRSRVPQLAEQLCCAQGRRSLLTTTGALVEICTDAPVYTIQIMSCYYYHFNREKKKKKNKKYIQIVIPLIMRVPTYPSAICFVCLSSSSLLLIISETRNESHSLDSEGEMMMMMMMMLACPPTLATHGFLSFAISLSLSLCIDILCSAPFLSSSSSFLVPVVVTHFFIRTFHTILESKE
eukprot:gene5708-4071_t